MAADLTELNERVHFAALSANALGTDINAFVNEAIEHWREEWGNTSAINARLLRPVPISIRSRSGMIVNELRSVLDALACRLAERNGKSAAGTYFPISNYETIFLEDGLKKIRKLSDADKAIIASLEPYGGGHPNLFLLHEADRVRKHQNLLACGGRGMLSPAGPGFIGMMMAGHEDGMLQNVGETVTIGVFQNVTTGIQLIFHVVYREPMILANLAVMEFFAQFYETVRDILARFD